MPRANKRGARSAAQNSLLGTRGGHQTNNRIQPAAVGEQNTFIGFTLQDEARNTAHAQKPWTQDARLRYRPVSFISGGATQPLMQQESPEQEPIGLLELADEGVESPYEVECDVPGTTAPDIGTTKGFLKETAPAQITTPPLSQLPYFVDVTGAKASQKGSLPANSSTRSRSPCRSDSSEEVILFKGRKHGGKVQQTSFNLQDIRDQIHVVADSLTEDEPRSILAGEENLGRGGSKSPRSWNGSRQRRDLPKRNKHEEDDILADYIANMREHGDDHDLILAPSYPDRDLGGTETPSSFSEEFRDVMEIKSSSKAAEVLGKVEGASGSDTDHISYDEREDEPASSEAIVPHQLNIATSDGGQESILVSGPVDDLLLTTLLNQDPAIDTFSGFPLATSPLAENDINAGRAGRRTDRLDSFDFMDWDRPSMQKRKKGARSQPVFDVSDSELEFKMQSAWKNDRLKKAEKKKQRSDLRSQGLIGKNVDPNDLRVRYPTGMSLEQISDELRSFLLGTEPSLMLPPMDAHARKIIHELCSKFNIKSKSSGKGDQRQPVLYRNLRTLKYSQETFDLAVSRIGRKYFSRLDTKAKMLRRGPVRGPGQGSGHAGTSYQDGEVVGASAPELGLQNKGWAMLEKMGWSSGTALGAENNKGILQPVTHVVKRSKAGLG